MKCPVCGRKHRMGTLVGFTQMNRKCAYVWEKRQRKLAASRSTER